MIPQAKATEGERIRTSRLQAGDSQFSALENIRPLVISQGLADAESHAAALREACEEVARGGCSVAYYVAYGQRVN